MEDQRLPRAGNILFNGVQELVREEAMLFEVLAFFHINKGSVRRLGAAASRLWQEDNWCTVGFGNVPIGN